MTKREYVLKALSHQASDKVPYCIRLTVEGYAAYGEQLLKDFAAKCSDVASMDKNAKLEGRNMSMFLSPKAK